MHSTRWFFWGSVIAVFLTVVLIISTATTPQNEGSPAIAFSPEALQGYGVWREFSCENCHTIYGQGGAYAPDLTHIYSQRGEAYLRDFMVNPEAFHVDQRVMPRFGLTISEMDHLMTFLDAVGQQPNAAKFPIVRVNGGAITLEADVSNDASSNAPPTDPVASGRYWFSRPPANCATCHSLEPNVVIVGPSLAGIATRARERVAGESAESYIRNSLINPGDYVVDGFANVMAQNLGDALSSDQINDIIAFLMTLE